MHIMHVALGGCLRPPPVQYGITGDTGGHIAYLLGAASAQVDASSQVRATLVTRAFDEPALGLEHGYEHQHVAERLCIRRLRTADTRYLSKAALSNALPALARAFLALIEDDRPDVIHAHFADAAELALTASRVHGMPVLYTPHSLALDPAMPRPLHGGGERGARIAREYRAIREADAIIVSSHDEAIRQIGAYDAGARARTHVARPGIDLASTCETVGARAMIDPWLKEPERPFLLAIARPVVKKNLTSLVDAYAGDDWLRAHANLVVIAGQHDSIRAERDEQAEQLDAIERRVRQHGLAGTVALPPEHDRCTVAQSYRLAAQRRGVFVNPALHEPFGLTLVEAARAGLPVVATDRGGPIDIVKTIGHGRLIDPGNVAELAMACRSLLQQPGEYERAHRAAVQRGGSYNWASWARTVQRVMKRVVNKRQLPVRVAPRPPAIRSVRAPRTGARTMATHLLAFDIDDTLTGSVLAVSRFERWERTRPATLPMVVATGRELPDAVAVLAHWKLPQPDVLITSVGAEIWRTDASGELQLCQDYRLRLTAGWDRAAIHASLQSLRPDYQADCTQRDHKVSLFGDEQFARRVRRRLHAYGLTVRVVASHGRFIDILPQSGGKAAAIEFEASRRGLPLSRCVSAGNSGNDVDMLTRCGKAILVGNALSEVRGIADRPALYRARAPYADGVLEGLAAHGLIEPAAAALPANTPCWLPRAQAS